MRLATWFLCGTVLMATGFGVSMAAQATRPQPEPDVLSALLVEVRGLRQAMEQIGTSGARVQLSLGRLQLQEQRVNSMIRRLESVRDAAAKAEKEHATTLAQVTNFENMFKENAKDVKPGDTNPMASMIEAFKKATAVNEAEILRLHGEAAQMEQQIANEQGRWAEINRTLEELERSLSKR